MLGTAVFASATAIGMSLGCSGAGDGELVHRSTSHEDTDAGTPGEDTGPGLPGWSRKIAGAHPESIAIDRATGDIVIGGVLREPIDFEEGEVLPIDGNKSTVFLAKFDRNGNPLWGKGLGRWRAGDSIAVAIDANGNIIVAGTFEEPIDLGSGELKSNSRSKDVFVGKYSRAGGYVFAKRFGGSSRDVLRSLAVHDDGSILFSGLFTGRINFGGSDLSQYGDEFPFVARLSPDGEHASSRSFDGPGVSSAVAFDSDGNIWVGGSFLTELDCGLGPMKSAGGRDGFIIKLDEELGCQWQHRFGTGLHENVSSVVPSPSSDVYLGGSAHGDEGEIAYLAKFTALGTLLWEREIPEAQLRGIADDGEGGIVLTGGLFGDGDFGGGLLASPPGLNVFFAAYDAAGDHRASSAFGGIPFSTGVGVALSASGAHVAVGLYHEGIDFGHGPLDGDGMFLVEQKLAP